MNHPRSNTDLLPREDVNSTKRALTVDEFMAAYGPGRTTTYEEIKAGRLKALKLGRKTLIPRESADAWLASLPVLDTATAA